MGWANSEENNAAQVSREHKKFVKKVVAKKQSTFEAKKNESSL